MKKEASSRIIGIDLLRLFSMYGIVVLHVIGKGGILDSSSEIMSVQTVVCYIIELVFLQAVNCYALISGYVIYQSREEREIIFHIDKYLSIWLQVVFYSVLIPLGAYVMHLTVFTDVLRGFFPVTTRIYWYFSAYTGLFFLRPYLNKLVDAFSEKDIKKYIMVLCFIFSIGGGILGRNADCFGLKNGYSVLWLILLYILGACLKKSKYLQSVRIKTIWLLFGTCYMITLFSCVLFPIIMKMFLHISVPRGILWSYLSPTIISMASCTLLLFSKIKIANVTVSRWISKLAAGAFGVYLIHSNPVFDRIVLDNRFISVGQQPVIVMITEIMGIAFLIFSMCLGIDLLRIVFFKKLKIRERIKNVKENSIRRG